MAGFLTDFSLSTFLASVVGSGTVAFAVVKGLSGHLADRWLAQHKAELDKEFETYRDTLEQRRKRLEAELSHRVYITQARFDTEFNVIKEIFAALGKLRLSFNALRPFWDRTPNDPQEKLKEISRRLSHVTERYNALVDTAESAYPFVPEDIYTEIEKCMQAAMIEIRHIEGAGAEALSPSGYDDGARQHEIFTTSYFVAARLVRERFNRLSVVSGGSSV
jgi:hypothetical protein